jgi:hypothetical protein
MVLACIYRLHFDEGGGFRLLLCGIGRIMAKFILVALGLIFFLFISLSALSFFFSGT